VPGISDLGSDVFVARISTIVLASLLSTFAAYWGSRRMLSSFADRAVYVIAASA